MCVFIILVTFVVFIPAPHAQTPLSAMTGTALSSGGGDGFLNCIGSVTSVKSVQLAVNTLEMQSVNQNGIIFTGTIYEWLIELLKNNFHPKKLKWLTGEVLHIILIKVFRWNFFDFSDGLGHGWGENRFQPTIDKMGKRWTSALAAEKCSLDLESVFPLGTCVLVSLEITSPSFLVKGE